MTNPRVSVVVTDLDNTLYDWFEIWNTSFRAMLGALSHQSGVAEDVLKKEARVLHQRYGTSEFSRLVEELPSLKKLHPGQELFDVYSEAIAAFREARRASMRLYPTVFETLWPLKKQKVLLIGYTESRRYYAHYRVRRLCLDGLLDYLHSPPDHGLPEGTSMAHIRRYPAEDYRLKVTIHHDTPEGELKPNPAILKSIIRDVGARIEQTIYVGDSEMKDIAMAKDAGVMDVLAKYGAVQHKEHYSLLQEVSHWTDEGVQREQEIKKRGKVNPTYVLEDRFEELLNLFDFVPFSRKQGEGTRGYDDIG